MKVDTETVDGSFVVWPWDKTPEEFRKPVLEDCTVIPRWVILTCSDNLDLGIPFWIDVMNPCDLFRKDLPNNITILGA